MTTNNSCQDKACPPTCKPSTVVGDKFCIDIDCVTTSVAYVYDILADCTTTSPKLFLLDPAGSPTTEHVGSAEKVSCNPSRVMVVDSCVAGSSAPSPTSASGVDCGGAAVNVTGIGVVQTVPNPVAVQPVKDCETPLILAALTAILAELQKPEFDFEFTVCKTPDGKQWIHYMVMDEQTQALVDQYKDVSTGAIQALAPAGLDCSAAEKVDTAPLEACLSGVSIPGIALLDAATNIVFTELWRDPASGTWGALPAGAIVGKCVSLTLVPNAVNWCDSGVCREGKAWYDVSSGSLVKITDLAGNVQAVDPLTIKEGGCKPNSSSSESAFYISPGVAALSGITKFEIVDTGSGTWQWNNSDNSGDSFSGFIGAWYAGSDPTLTITTEYDCGAGIVGTVTFTINRADVISGAPAPTDTGFSMTMAGVPSVNPCGAPSGGAYFGIYPGAWSSAYSSGGCRPITIISEKDCSGSVTVSAYEQDGTPILPFDPINVYRGSAKERSGCALMVNGEQWNVIELVSPCGTVQYFDPDVSPIADITADVSAWGYAGECICCKDIAPAVSPPSLAKVNPYSSNCISTSAAPTKWTDATINWQVKVWKNGSQVFDSGLSPAIGSVSSANAWFNASGGGFYAANGTWVTNPSMLLPDVAATSDVWLISITELVNGGAGGAGLHPVVGYAFTNDPALTGSLAQYYDVLSTSGAIDLSNYTSLGGFAV